MPQNINDSNWSYIFSEKFDFSQLDFIEDLTA
jgi:hypothetical protein